MLRMNEWKTYAGRLIWAMQHAGKTNQSELARVIGIKPQSIQYLCRRDAGAQGSKHTAALADALGVSSRWLARNEGLPERFEPAGMTAAELAPAGYGMSLPEARVGVSGAFRVNGAGDIEAIDLPPGETDGHLPMPMPMQAGRARAVRIKGNALSPFVKDGQYLLLQDAGPLHSEENVVLELADGRLLIRELLHDKADAVVLLPLHGGQPEAIERDTIVRLTRVICALPQSLWRSDEAPA